MVIELNCTTCYSFSVIFPGIKIIPPNIWIYGIIWRTLIKNIKIPMVEKCQNISGQNCQYILGKTIAIYEKDAKVITLTLSL